MKDCFNFQTDIYSDFRIEFIYKEWRDHLTSKIPDNAKKIRLPDAEFSSFPTYYVIILKLRARCFFNALTISVGGLIFLNFYINTFRG